MTITGFFDDRMSETLPRTTPFAYHRVKGARPFRCIATLTPNVDIFGEISFDVHLSPADKRRLVRYLSPKVRARMRQIHSAYRRRR